MLRYRRRKGAGRSTSILPPRNPAVPFVFPRRKPRMSAACSYRPPDTTSAAPSAIICRRLDTPAVRQNRSKLAPTSSHTLATIPSIPLPVASLLSLVQSHITVLLPFVFQLPS